MPQSNLRLSTRGTDTFEGHEVERARPLVSVIIPTKNRCILLEQTLKSVSAQTYINWEALVVDDGSTDGTTEMVQWYCGRDDRIRWIVRPEGQAAGGSSCRNLGHLRSSGEYVLFLDSDDLLTPTCLEDRVEYIQQHQELDFASFQAEAFDEAPGDLNVAFNSPSTESDLDRFLHLDHPWQTTGPIWRSASLTRIGGWDSSLPSWQDWELNLRALCRGLTYQQIHQCDYYFRRKPSKERINSLQRGDRTHLNMAISLFVKVRDELVHTGNMTLSRSQAITGLAFLTVMRLNQDHGLLIGFSGWRRSYLSGLLGFGDFAMGLIVLACLKPPLLRSIARRTILKWFRHRIHWNHKKTIL